MLGQYSKIAKMNYNTQRIGIGEGKVDWNLNFKPEIVIIRFTPEGNYNSDESKGETRIIPTPIPIKGLSKNQVLLEFDRALYTIKITFNNITEKGMTWKINSDSGGAGIRLTISYIIAIG